MFGIIPFKTNNSDVNSGYAGNLFDDFFNSDFLAPVGMNKEAVQFKTDITETNNEYIISADLPGVDKKDIRVDYKNKYLIISAKREEKYDEKKDSYIRKEKTYGEFSRSFYFDNIQSDKINAKFENGVLKVELPKEVKEEDRSTSIEIK